MKIVSLSNHPHVNLTTIFMVDLWCFFVILKITIPVLIHFHYTEKRGWDIIHKMAKMFFYKSKSHTNDNNFNFWINCYFNMLCDPDEHRHKGTVSNFSIIKNILHKELTEIEYHFILH